MNEPLYRPIDAPARGEARETEESDVVLTSSRSAAHLRRLEAESIFILREVVAECRAPVMLYSIGKDSSVMLHLALKAFYPARPPFPLLHVDTMWEFREMTELRDRTVARLGLDLIAYTNETALRDGVNPFDHGAYYTHAMKTEALKSALAEGGFDAAFGGARRDEEKSRAKERIFSFRTERQEWDPKNQRPEFWSVYNGRVNRGESIRVFPLSNWTELDIWHYIMLEKIEVVPLYFAQPQPTVMRDGTIIVVHEPERMRWLPGEAAVMQTVRFRSLGCWPNTGAVLSNATTIEDVVAEMLTVRESERGGRLIDREDNDSMEKKKREGYF